jgi:hypothetical protein
MKAAISRRRCVQLLGTAGLASIAGGCSSLLARKPRETEVAAANIAQTTPDPLGVVYRTRTDRLNLAGAHLPHCSIAELSIQYPHPTLKSTMCHATVRTTPCSVDATPFPDRGVSSTITSLFDGTASDGSAPPSQAWSADVALWEVEAIIASLEKLNFFRKHRTVLTAEVFLSVKTAEHAVGKKYRPVAELDAMLVRIAQSPNSGNSIEQFGLARLPFID